MNSKVVVFAGLIVAGALAASPAIAQQTGSIGASTTAPIGWVQFCQEEPQECVNRSLPATAIKLDEKSWRVIVRINAEVI